MTLFRSSALSVFLILFGVVFAHAQVAKEDEPDLDQIEAEIQKSAPKYEEPIITTKSSNSVKTNLQSDKSNSSNETGKAEGESFEEAAPVKKFESITDLEKLSPFSDVSVIQKRFQPKSERFQFFGGLSYVANDPWFLGGGFNLRVAYGFTEAWSIEGVYYNISSQKREAIQNLADNNGVDTTSLISTKNYAGVSVMWTPIYGKMSLYDRRIIPFDMYFTLGSGNSTLSGGDTSAAPGISYGTGQIFALSKSMAFRWDLTGNTFQAKSDSRPQTFTNFLLSAGVSFYFPEAKYR